MYNEFIEIWGPVIDAFKLRYPHVATKLVDWYPCGRNEIMIKTDKGDKAIFSYIGETLRVVGRDEDRRNSIDDIDEDPWRKEFSARLCNTMAMAGIPRWELSQLTSISEATLSKYMNGHSTPSTYNTRKIARALGCPVTELVDFVV